MAPTLSSSDFIQQFYSLTGTTIGERRKNLFVLLHQASRNKLIIDVKQLQPKTPLEESFKLEILIYFNKNEELLKELTSRNPVLVHRTIKKASHTLVAALCETTSTQLLNFLSEISLNAKLKILNKCGDYLDNTEKAEEFFKAIRDKYGIYLATKLLTACSPEFILDFLGSTRFKFTSHQFLIITKKHPDVVDRLLKILQKHVNVTNDYKNVFKYLSRYNVPLFITLHKTYDLATFRLGSRATNNFIQHDKSNVINNAKTYSEIFQNKYIRKSLRGEDFNLYYYGLFPPLITQFEQSYPEILTQAPSLDILLKGFQRSYNTELFSESKLITPKLLEMMTNEQRLKILKPEYKPDSVTDDEWVCYLSTSDAITSLKKRISLTSDIKSRATLIGLLVETCRINKDKVALLELCNYMVKQHRNDHITVRVAFLKGIKRGFKLENLEMAHWTVLNELIQIFELNGEDFFHISEFTIGYIQCCLKNKQPIKDALTPWLKRQRIWGSWNLFNENPAYEKICLQTIPEILPELKLDSSISKTLAYYNALINWNKRHPKDTFPVFDNPNIIEGLQGELQKENNYDVTRFWDIIVRYILKSKTIADRQVLLKLSIPYMDLNKINWLVRADVRFVIDNVDVCMRRSLELTGCINSLWCFCKLYNHLDLPQKIIDVCKQTLSQELPQDNAKLIKKNSLTAMSYFMPTSDLVTLKYNVGPYLKNTAPNALVIETIITYCNTHRLPSVKRTLFSLMNNISESESLQLLLLLVQSENVRVRKVALYILFRNMEKQTIMNVLKEFLSQPRNASLNKFILSRVFKYFIKNPNDYLWDIIQLCVGALDVDDYEAYSLVLQPQKVPEEYLIRYVLFMWGNVEKLSEFYTEFGIKLLQVAPASSLPQEFCDALIEKYFFSYTKNYAEFYVELQAFVCKYICNNPAKLEEYVSKVIEASRDVTNFKLRSYVNHFVRQMCYECTKQNKKDVLLKFAAQWDNTLKPYTMFCEYLYIQLSLIKIENLPIPEIATRIVKLCTFLTDSYGTAFLHPFSQELKAFVSAHFVKGVDAEEEEIKRYTLIENIVESSDAVTLTLLGIWLLQDHPPNLIETKSKYDNLTTIFGKRTEPEVRICLSELLQI